MVSVQATLCNLSGSLLLREDLTDEEHCDLESIVRNYLGTVDAETWARDGDNAANRLLDWIPTYLVEPSDDKVLRFVQDQTRSVSLANAYC